MEYQLFEAILTCLKQRRLLKARGRKRTDATHVLAVQAVNLVVRVGETVPVALNSPGLGERALMTVPAHLSLYARSQCRGDVNLNGTSACVGGLDKH
jgi:hypothetical protein